MPRHLETDRQALEEAEAIQKKTLDALQRIQSTAAETEETGISTLGSLKEQKDQFTRVFEAADRVDAGLLKTEKLQDRMSLWSLRFNKRSAKRDVDRERKDAKKLAQEHAKLARQRLKERKGEADEEDEDPKTKTVNQKKKKANKKTKKSRTVNDEFDTKKDLLYGVDEAAAGKHKAKLDELNAVDEEIDQALDSVAKQVDSILAIGKEMNTEINSQDRQMDTLVERVERTKYKQAVVNKRTTKFLDGNLRKQHDMLDTLSPVSVASKAIALNSTMLEI